MSEIKTVLIDDNRISGITDEILMAVKKGPSSSVIQSYKQISNSSSNVLFNVNVPSENTLVNRNIRVNTTLQMQVVFGAGAGGLNVKDAVPASFPLNTGLSSASVTINNTKLTVQSQDICEILKKQYDQEFLSKTVQTTPIYVDKYWGSISDAGTDTINSSYMTGVKFAEKDSNVSGRGDVNMTVKLYTVTGVPVAESAAGTLLITDAAAGYYADYTIKVSEPILGLPTFELKDDEACYLGVNNLELTLQLNDCKHVLYFPAALEGLITSRGPGQKHDNSTTFLSDDSKLTMQYLTLHPSDYSKLSPKNVIPYNEFVSYKTTDTITLASTSTTIISNQVQLRQIPDKIYISVSPQYSTLPTTVSNHLCFPISNIGITFNNRANLLSEMDVYDLYTMSKRNGSHQSYNEFRGVVRDLNGSEYLSLGSVLVIDPRDLSLDDYLSSGSIGQYSFQASVTAGALKSIVPFGTTVNLACQLNIICSYGGVLVTQQGSSASMSGLLTKNLVLETKESGMSVGDYEEVESMAGGNIGRSLTSLGSVMRKKGKKIVRNKIDGISSKLDGGSYQMSAGSKGRLSKYM